MGERFVALWTEHAPRVMAYALRHVGPDGAEDVVAETFLVAWRRLDRVPEDALPWLLVVARKPSRTNAGPAFGRHASRRSCGI